MRKYADIVNEDIITESIETGICEVVQGRLAKTMGMVENLIMDLKSDDEARDTVAALNTLLTTLQHAWTQVDDVVTTTIDGNVKGIPSIKGGNIDYSDPLNYPMADPTGTFKDLP